MSTLETVRRWSQCPNRDGGFLEYTADLIEHLHPGKELRSYADKTCMDVQQLEMVYGIGDKLCRVTLSWQCVRVSSTRITELRAVDIQGHNNRGDIFRFASAMSMSIWLPKEVQWEDDENEQWQWEGQIGREEERTAFAVMWLNL